MVILMSEERFCMVDDDTIVEHNQPISIEQVVKKLNYYENNRLKRKREIAQYKAREERYQRVIGGIMAYLELQINNDLWWDWND